jgi:asparagine synthase (glutamine-hydrolysing)
MFLLSRLVRERGIKVVLTGEGADEMFAGYDLFREAKVRRFWARHPESTLRPRLLERLYPYLERSPSAQRAMARGFFGRDLASFAEPGFSHGPRWRSAAALKRLFSREQRQRTEGLDVSRRLLDDLPSDFRRWASLAQDQYLGVRTLLPGYILSSQGDRMLMANSIEGRFPFLDMHVMELANSLSPAMKLNVLSEKHVLKGAAKDLLPESVLARKKQPYRAPDGQCFTGPDAPEWVSDVLSGARLRDAGVFDPVAVGRLFDKCRAQSTGPLSNADNMAVVGVLSTQLLFELTKRPPASSSDIDWMTLVDRSKRAGSRS